MFRLFIFPQRRDVHTICILQIQTWFTSIHQLWKAGKLNGIQGPPMYFVFDFVELLWFCLEDNRNNQTEYKIWNSKIRNYVFNYFSEDLWNMLNAITDTQWRIKIFCGLWLLLYNKYNKHAKNIFCNNNMK